MFIRLDDITEDFDQVVAGTGITLAAVPVEQSWALTAYPRFEQAVEARWALSAPATGDQACDQRWAIPAAALPAARSWEQRWAMNFAELTFGQQWRSEATAVWTRVVSATAYLFSLEQGSDRAEIPISSFSGQFRSGNPSYLQVAIPNATLWAETLAAYAAHDDTAMVIHAGYRYSDGTYQTVEIARVTLRNVRLDYGPKSSTISLDGIATRTNPSPKSVRLSGASYRSVADAGRVRYRCAMDFSVRPGDTVTVAGETFVVGELSYQVNADSAQMEVAEASG